MVSFRHCAISIHSTSYLQRINNKNEPNNLRIMKYIQLVRSLYNFKNIFNFKQNSYFKNYELFDLYLIFNTRKFKCKLYC